MADTPTDGTPETPATKPAPRRRTRSTSATTPKTRRGGSKAAAETSAVKPPRAKPGPKPKLKTAAAETNAPRKTRAVRAKSSDTAKAATKPQNRVKLIAGVTAAALGIGGAVAAVLGRKKIAAVSGDVMEAVSAKTEDTKSEPGPASGTIEAPSQSPVPPVS